MNEENQTEENLEVQKQNFPSEKNAASALKVDELMQVLPTNFSELYRYATVLSRSDLVPKDYRGKPDNVVVAIQYGAEIGLKPLQAMQGIAVINGRPTLWGDHFLAVIRASGALEYIIETDDGKEATCRTKRVGEKHEIIRTFSMDDAKTAGLLSKQGPWTTYPKRMRQMRARGFACRDAFADVLKGFALREEENDYVEVEEVKEKISLMPKRASETKTDKTFDMKDAHIVFDDKKIIMDDLHSFNDPVDPFAKISAEKCEKIRNGLIANRRQSTAFYEFLKANCKTEKIDDVTNLDFEKVMNWIIKD